MVPLPTAPVVMSSAAVGSILDRAPNVTVKVSSSSLTSSATTATRMVCVSPAVPKKATGLVVTTSKSSASVAVPSLTVKARLNPSCTSTGEVTVKSKLVNPPPLPSARLTSVMVRVAVSSLTISPMPVSVRSLVRPPTGVPALMVRLAVKDSSASITASSVTATVAVCPAALPAGNVTVSIA